VKFGSVFDELRTTSSSQLAAPETHTTGPNFTLPNTDYAHKTSEVISVKHVLILPEIVF